MTEQSGLRVPATYTLSLVREFGEFLRAHGDAVDLSALEASAATGQTQLDLLFTLIDALNDSVGPEWPVKASFAWRNQMHGTIDAAARSADTFGDALDVLVRYGTVRATFARIAEHTTAKDRIFKFRASIPMADAHWQVVAEFMVLGTMAIMNQMTDGKLAGVRVQMPDRSYEHRRLLEQSLQVSIEFGGDEFGMRFSHEVLATPLPFRDPVLFKAATAQLQSEATQLSQHQWVVEDVRRLLASSKGQRPDAQSVARQLGLSQRSLVRKLAAHGTSFRQLLDDHLRDRAIALMERGDLTSEAIAEELGYQDRTSFSRAKRRWFGKDS